MKNNSIMIEEMINAPVEKVWQAITDKDQMKKWYFDLAEFNPVAGFEFKFDGTGHTGQKYVHLCKITEVIPSKKLQYSWQFENYEGYSLITFELYEDGVKTKVKLTHEGVESFPPDNSDFAAESFMGGWTHLIKISLKELFENKTK